MRFLLIALNLLLKNSYNRVNPCDSFEIEKDFDFENDLRILIDQNRLSKIICLVNCLENSDCYFLTHTDETCRLYNKYALVKKFTSSESLVYRKASGFDLTVEDLDSFFTTTSTTPMTTISPIISTINNIYGINWGEWGLMETCDIGNYVIGFRTKLQEEQGPGLDFDDSALNGIELICSDGKTLRSAEGPYGTWDSNMVICPNNQSIHGFKYGIENYVDIRDDTATNVIRLKCSDNIILQSLEGPWSSSISTLYCPYGVVTGIRTQVEADKGSDNDITGLNNVELFCKVIE